MKIFKLYISLYFLCLNLFIFQGWNFKIVNGSNIKKHDNLNYNDIIDVSNFFLNENYITEIPYEIYFKTKPTRIYLNFRNSFNVSPKIQLFTSLILFYLSNNSLTDFCKLPKILKSIYLNQNKLKILPKHFYKLSNLKNTNLSHNLLHDIPKLIVKLYNLKYLNLNNNIIFNIHSSIGKLLKIEKILLSNNNIKSVPSSIKNLNNLSFLDLSHNKLSKFPNPRKKLIKLKELFLSNNLITNFETICTINSLKHY